MKIDIHHIPADGLTLAFERSAEHFSGLKALMKSGECELAQPLVIDLDVLPMSDFIRVKGRFRTTLRQACVRCLEDFDRMLQSRFTLDYSREIPKDVHKNDSEGIELTAQQIGMIYFGGDEIDFTDALQEQVILAIPYKPLCNENCKGLCPQCGGNLNHGPCQCREKTAEGPFAILKNLKLPSDD